MNLKPTLVLLVIVAALSGWIFFKESKQPIPIGPQTKRLFKAFEPGDETRIAICRGEGLKEEIVFTKVVVPASGDKKETKTWKLEKPVADEADDAKLRELLSKVQFLDWEQKYEGEQAKNVQFGPSPLETLEISRPQDKGGDLKVLLGAKLGSDSVFARVAGRDTVAYLVKKDLSELLEKSLFEFRKKELFSISGIDVDKLVVKSLLDATGPGAQPKLLEIFKRDRFWHIGGQDGELLDTRKIDDLLPKVRDLKPVSIEKDAPTEADLAAYGLTTPAVELTLIQDIKDQPPKVETLSLGAPVKDKETRYARFSGRAFVYTVDPGALLVELRKDPEKLRTDTLLPLHAGTDGVTGLSAKWKAGHEELKVKKTENDWNLESPVKVKGEETAIKALLKQVADLKVAAREDEATSKALDKLGLADPVLRVTLDEGSGPRVFQVGFPVPDKDGLWYVRRADEARVLEARLGDLQAKLENASRGLRTKTLLKASHWEAVSFKILDPSGKVTFEANKKDNKWQLADKPDLDVNDRFGKFLETFDELKAIDFAADVKKETLSVFDLDPEHARKLVVTVESYDSAAGQKKKEDRVLLLGKRDPENHLYAIEENGVAAARIDGEFLDRIARGFQKEKELFATDVWSASALIVKKGETEELRLEKRKDGVEDEWFLGARKLEKSAVDKVIEGFSRVEGSRTEEATDAKKKERGLSPPQRTITVKSKKTWDKDHPEETKTLLIGGKAGERDVYAMDEAGTELGVIFDAPLGGLQKLIDSPPFAKASLPGEGVGPVGSPDTAAVTSPSK